MLEQAVGALRVRVEARGVDGGQVEGKQVRAEGEKPREEAREVLKGVRRDVFGPVPLGYVEHLPVRGHVHELCENLVRGEQVCGRERTSVGARWL